MILVFCPSRLAAWAEGDQSPWTRGLVGGGLNEFSVISPFHEKIVGHCSPWTRVLGGVGLIPLD